MSVPPPSAVSVENADLAVAGRALRAAGLTEMAVADAERIVPRQLDAVRVPLVCSELARRGDAGSVLTRLFVYDDAVTEAEARKAMPGATFDVLRKCGLIEARGEVRAAGRIVPFLGCLVAADSPVAGLDAVMPPGPTTQQIGQLLPDEPAGRALDVATGPGSLALALAARGMQVVGTDVSERALEFARFNAAFNDLDIEWRLGSLLEPVAGERFDVVVGQPPFIPLPDALAGVTFLHSGPMGDELALALLAALPDVMADGGVGLVRFDAPVREEPVLMQLRRVIPIERADLAVLTWRGPNADQEAYSYASITDPDLGPDYRRSAVVYREHLRTHGIESFVQAVAFVRAAGRVGAWTAALPLDLAPGSWSGLAGYVAALDAASSPDADLLALRLAPVAGVRVHAVRSFGDNEEPVMTLTPRPGTCATSGEIGDDIVVLLDAFAGGRAPVIVAALHAEVTGQPHENSEGLILESVRRALTSGWLVPA